MKVMERKHEFIEFSQNHTLEETVKYFGICKSYAQLLRKKWCGIEEPGKKLSLNKADFISFKREHCMRETAEHFKISLASAYNYSKIFNCHHFRVFKNKAPHIVNGHDIAKEFPEYAPSHTRKECSAYFGVNKSTIRWWMEKYKVKPLSKGKTIKQFATVLYILDNGKQLYYFVKIDDIAEFVGLTKTQTNMLILKKSQIHEYKVRKEPIIRYL